MIRKASYTAFTLALFIAGSMAGKVNAYINVVPVEKSERSMVQVTSPANVSASIFIYDKDGTRLVSDMISPEASTKYYDFTDLPDGIYSFESFTDNMNIAKEIEVSNSRVEILSKTTEFKPFFLVEGDQLKVSFLNQQMQNMAFSIENVNEVFYQENEGNELTFNKKFNVKDLRPGEYYARLEVDGRAFYHHFRIR